MSFSKLKLISLKKIKKVKNIIAAREVFVRDFYKISATIKF